MDIIKPINETTIINWLPLPETDKKAQEGIDLTPIIEALDDNIGNFEVWG